MDDPTPTVDAPSKPPRRFRRTRIAVSVFFGVVTVALCVLWVRNQSEFIFASRDNGIITQIGINNDYVFFISRDLATPKRTRGWKNGTAKAYGEFPHFEWDRRTDGIRAVLPLWCVALSTTVATLLPWASYPFGPRFSLRTMLIATTLVAVVLALGVWLAS